MVIKARSYNDLLGKISILGKKIEAGGYVFVPRTISSNDLTKLGNLVRWMEVFLEIINSEEVNGGTLPLTDINGGRDLMMKSLINITVFIMNLLDVDVHKGDVLIPDNLVLFVLSRFLDELLDRNLLPQQQ